MADSPLALLADARRVLDRYMFDGDTCRDDVAEVCQKIDDFLPAASAEATRDVIQKRAAA